MFDGGSAFVREQQVNGAMTSVRFAKKLDFLKDKELAKGLIDDVILMGDV